MGIRFLQVLFFNIVVFQISFAAKHPICAPHIDIMSAQNILELEKMGHPLCLKEEIDKVVNQNYQNLEDWIEAHNFLKMAQRLPKSWDIAYKAYPFLSPQNKGQFKNTSVDYAWLIIEKDSSQKLIKQFFSKYKGLRHKIDKSRLSPAAKKHLDKYMPFF